MNLDDVNTYELETTIKKSDYFIKERIKTQEKSINEFLIKYYL